MDGEEIDRSFVAQHTILHSLHEGPVDIKRELVGRVREDVVLINMTHNLGKILSSRVCGTDNFNLESISSFDYKQINAHDKKCGRAYSMRAVNHCS